MKIQDRKRQLADLMFSGGKPSGSEQTQARLSVGNLPNLSAKRFADTTVAPPLSVGLNQCGVPDIGDSCLLYTRRCYCSTATKSCFCNEDSIRVFTGSIATSKCACPDTQKCRAGKGKAPQRIYQQGCSFRLRGLARMTLGWQVCEHPDFQCSRMQRSCKHIRGAGYRRSSAGSKESLLLAHVFACLAQAVP